MAFTRKLKTVSKWFAFNEAMRRDENLRAALEGDGGVVDILGRMQETLRNIYIEATGGTGAQSGIELTLFPCPKRLYFGELSYDIFTPTQKKVKSGPNKGRSYTAYVGNYGQLFASQAAELRDRVWTIIEIARQDNDMVNSVDAHPNPGGVVLATSKNT